LAAEPKCLDTTQGYADCVGIVPVWSKRLTAKECTQSFDARDAGFSPDVTVPFGSAGSGSAQPFKTFPASAGQTGVGADDRTGITMTGQSILDPEIWKPVFRLTLASAVLMGSPGPSTMSVVAVGVAYGFRRSLKYGCGLILGTMIVLFAVAIGVVTFLLSIPHGAPVLVAISSIYMLYLAFKIATAPPLAGVESELAAPAISGGLLLAITNPKAYLAIAAVYAGTTISGENPRLDVAVKLALLSVMIVVIHLCWLFAGASLSHALQQPVVSRFVNVLLAAALVVTIAVTMLE
jgi:threonine/homoserine/homoserine lactone efflux protein